jgi:gamma-glutamylputrescine oxidase
MYINKDFNHSYWEKKHLFKAYDVIIVGAGIVGLSTAISIKEKDKKRSVLIIEQGSTANGASTKNAGFACFGSVGEILDDLNSMPHDLVWDTIQMRLNGLHKLRKRLGDKHMNYLPYGGFEVFNNALEFEKCSEQIDDLNKHLKQNFNLKNCFVRIKKNNFGFQNIKGILKNQYEGQIDTGLMMQNLALLANQKGVQMLFNCALKNFAQIKTGVQLQTNLAHLSANKLVIATNGFAKQLLPQLDVEPARLLLFSQH